MFADVGVAVIAILNAMRAGRVKEKKLPANQFISWLIGQEAVIEGICNK